MCNDDDWFHIVGEEKKKKKFAKGKMQTEEETAKISRKEKKGERIEREETGKQEDAIAL